MSVVNHTIIHRLQVLTNFNASYRVIREQSKLIDMTSVFLDNSKTVLVR